MKSSILISVLALLMLALSADLIAQEAMPIKPGDRVRVKTKIIERSPWPHAVYDKIVGTVVGFRTDTLVLNVEGLSNPLTVPITSLNRLEVNRGQRRGGPLGAFIGLVSGAAFGWLLGSTEASLEGPPAEYVGAVVFGGIGFVVGAVVGPGTTDRWEKVPLDKLRVGILPSYNRGLAFSVSLALPSIH